MLLVSNCTSRKGPSSNFEYSGGTKAVNSMTTVSSFGTNPGGLNMYSYAPNDMPANAPLVMVLHGCSQSASSYATETEWNELADRFKFYVVHGEKPFNACFTWYNSSNAARDAGESLSLKQMIDQMKTDFSIDDTQVYVTGLSAGGYMASVMMAAYPDVFAAGAVMAGGPSMCGPEYTSSTCQYSDPDYSGATWAALVTNAYPSFSGSYPRLMAVHGSTDGTVRPSQMTELMQQWTSVHGIDETPEVDEAYSASINHKEYHDSSGNNLVETYYITGMGHAISVDPGSGETQGGATATYSVDKDFYSSYYAAKFFGLTDGSGGGGTTPPADDDFANAVEASTDSHQVISDVLDITGPYRMVVTGGQLIKSSDGKLPWDTKDTTSGSVEIESGATIEYAFLYYSGTIAMSGGDYTTDNLNTATDVMNNGIRFQINSGGWSSTLDPNNRQPASQSTVGSDSKLGYQTHYDFGTLTGVTDAYWSNRLDVTGMLQGQTGTVTFTVEAPEYVDTSGNDSSNHGNNPAGSTEYNECSSNTNWGLVVIYKKTGLSSRQIVLKDGVIRAWDYTFFHKGYWERPKVTFTHAATQASGVKYYAYGTGTKAGKEVITKSGSICGCGCGGKYSIIPASGNSSKDDYYWPKSGMSNPLYETDQYWSNTLVDPSPSNLDPMSRDKNNGNWILTDMSKPTIVGNDWTKFVSGSKSTVFPNLYEGEDVAGVNHRGDTDESITNENWPQMGVPNSNNPWGYDSAESYKGHNWTGKGEVYYHGVGNSMSVLEVRIDSANITEGATSTTVYLKADQKDVFKPQARINMFFMALETIPSGPDTTNPTVSVTAPSDSANVYGTVNVTASASDDRGVSSVKFFIDGTEVGSDTESPYEYSWDTSALTDDTSHTIVAKAYDAATNEGVSTTITVTKIATPADTEKPAVNITSPANSASISTGDTVTITASASDNVGVSSVEFFINGTSVATDSSAPYEYSWDTTGLADGNYAIKAIASDATGNTETDDDTSVSLSEVTICHTETKEDTALNLYLANDITTDQYNSYYSKYSTSTFKVYHLDAANGGNWVDVDDLPAGCDSGDPQPGDTEDPTGVNVTAPSNGITVDGTVIITASASDNVGVASVEFFINGTSVGTDTTSPYEYSWDTTSETNGSFSLKVVASDAAGNSASDDDTSVTVNNTTPDTEDPTGVNITAPANAAEVSGTVTIIASASDNVGIADVKFYINNTLVSTDTTSPYEYSWDTTAETNGSFALKIVASDAAGNSATDDDTSVDVLNSGGGNICHTETKEDTALNLYLAGDITTAQYNSYYTKYGSSTFTVYHLDAANGEGWVDVDDLPAGCDSGTSTPDTESPTGVNVTAPSSGTTVDGTVTITASASDNVGVADVKFYINNTLVSTDTTSPYEYSWDTTAETNGSFALKIVASDAAGNSTTDDDTSVTVSNTTPDTEAPTGVNITAPSSGTTVDGTATITASASDNVGVSDVKFYINNTLVSTDSTEPYEYSWDTTSETNGSFSLKIVASDAAGNSTTDDDTSVTVSNTTPDTEAPTGVNVTAPANSAEVSGIVIITASASDNVGVSDVKFYINGTLVSTDTTAPYEYSWDTTSETNGSFSLKVVASDAAGNSTTDDDTSVDVLNSGGFSCQEWTDSNYNHVLAGRATQNASWHAITVGGGDDLGLNNTYTTTTVKETSSGYFEMGSCN